MFRFYRSLSLGVLKPLIETKIFENASARRRIFENAPVEKKKKRIWFHASSVGELEMLIPIIEGREEELVLTIFSESAESALKKLAGRIAQEPRAETARTKATGADVAHAKGADGADVAHAKEFGAEVLFAGYCPWEGEWKKALELYEPDLFVSARYEAWPELWASLGELKIPLTIVGAQLRTSLKVAKKVVSLMLAELPSLRLLSIEETEVESLQREFPLAKVSAAGDPRWDRVVERAKQGNPRARQLAERFEKCERDWGVLGSAWLEDLGLLGKEVFELPGTIWVVPHQVDPEHIKEFENWLSERHIDFVKTSSFGESSSKNQSKSGSESLMPRCILVDEMGFLSELYSVADWAYVGGGFGKGVHNTIEPAIYGIPIFCGPAKNHRFPEVEYLRELGQLIVLKSSEDVVQLRNTVTRGHFHSTKSVWKESAHRKMGAAARITKILDESLVVGDSRGRL